MFYSLIRGVNNNDYKNLVLEHSDRSHFTVDYFTLYISQVLRVAVDFSCAASKNMLLKCVFFCLCVSAAPFVPFKGL